MSNGYVRRICDKCIFYSSFQDMGCTHIFCTCQKEGYQDPMKYVSAHDYERYPDIRKKHDEPCKYYINTQELKQIARKAIIQRRQEVENDDTDTI